MRPVNEVTTLVHGHQKKVSSRLSCVIFVGTFVSSPWPSLLDVILCCPFLLHGVVLLPNWFIRLFCLGREASNVQCTWFRNILLEVSGKVIAHRLALISKAHCSESFTMPSPCYYIQASDDRLVPKAMSSWFEKNISGLRVLPLQAPHCILQTKPVESAKVIENVFLQTHEVKPIGCSNERSASFCDRYPMISDGMKDEDQ